MNIYLPNLAVFALVGLATASSASTPDSWANLNTRVNRACIAMSGLAYPQILAQKISTSDAVGVEIRLVRGTDDRNRFYRKICVYNRKTSRTEVQDAGGWFGATVKP